MTKLENISLLRERSMAIRALQANRKGDMDTLAQFLERCQQEIEAMEFDCQYPYPCFEECYCYQNGMRGENE